MVYLPFLLMTLTAKLSQEDVIYEATDEYIQSVLKVDSDINESAKAMGSSYAHNEENMKTQGWSEVGKQIKEKIKLAISNAEYDTKTILPVVPNFCVVYFQVCVRIALCRRDLRFVFQVY